MAETPMVQRVGRAVYEGRNGAGCLPWQHRDASHKAPYRENAVAAIAAMREPSPAVIAAVENMAEERYNAAPAMLRWYGQDVWAVGIDAALEEPEVGRET